MATPLSEELLSQLAAYCKVDVGDPEVEFELAAFYHGAVSYLAMAGVPKPDENSPARPSYDLLVNAMVLSDYDNRGADGTEKILENPAFRRRLNQLKFTLGVAL